MAKIIFKDDTTISVEVLDGENFILKPHQPVPKQNQKDIGKALA